MPCPRLLALVLLAACGSAAARTSASVGTCFMSDVYNEASILVEFSRLNYPQTRIDTQGHVARTRHEGVDSVMKGGRVVAAPTPD